MAGAIQGQTYLITIYFGGLLENTILHSIKDLESLGGGGGRNNVPLESLIIFQKL